MKHNIIMHNLDEIEINWNFGNKLFLFIFSDIVSCHKKMLEILNIHLSTILLVCLPIYKMDRALQCGYIFLNFSPFLSKINTALVVCVCVCVCVPFFGKKHYFIMFCISNQYSLSLFKA